jgi:glycosyltransferase involved in cell wall biosynthesis
MRARVCDIRANLSCASIFREVLVSVPNPCLSVVIPAYNEEKTIQRVLEKLVQLPHLHEIIIVDDCSTDGTLNLANMLASEFPQIIVARHSKNQGKTAALKTGFRLSTGAVVIVQDADLEYDPEDIPSLIQPILDGHADVVYGSRFLIRRAARVLYFYHYLANRALTFLSNLFTNINLTDVETGYKVFRGEIIREMIINSSGFGFEIEVTAKVAKLKCAIFEAPISYYGRTYEEGKKIGFRDAVAAVWYILRFNLLCGLKGSYRAVPVLPRDQISQPGEVRREDSEELQPMNSGTIARV